MPLFTLKVSEREVERVLRQHAKDNRVQMSQEQIAEQIPCCRQTVASALRRLEKAGRIAIDGKRGPVVSEYQIIASD